MEKEKVLPYLQNICAKREYCRSEILKKAETALEGDRQAAQEMLDSLVADRFVDDARYAAAFARERSSLTGWGPEKIRYSLMMKGISKADISAALEQIDSDAAEVKLHRWIVSEYHLKCISGIHQRVSPEQDLLVLVDLLGVHRRDS